jgi:hypothetical protein
VAAGLDDSVTALNRTCGMAVLALVNAMDNITRINEMLVNTQRGFAVVTNPDSSTTDPLTTGANPMTDDEAATLRNSFAALALYVQVGYGQIAQSGAQPSNFFFDAQNLLGTNPL